MGKLLGTITLPDGNEPTSIQCINGYSLLIVATSMGFMICFNFFLKDSGLNFRTMIISDLNKIVPSYHIIKIMEHLMESDVRHLSEKNFIQRIICDITGGEAEVQQNIPQSIQ